MSGPPDYVTPYAQGVQLGSLTPDVGGAFMSGIQTDLARRVQAAQMQRQLGQQQMLDQATRQFITNPTPENIRALAALNPQGFTAIKTQHDMQTGDQQRQDLQDLTATAGYLRAGRSDDAQAIVQKRIDAMKAAGQDTTSLDHLLSTIQDNPEAAKGMINYSLAAVLGPDKFGEAFPALEGNDRNNEELPSKIALTKAQTAEAQATTAKTAQETENLKNPPPETAVATDAYGNPKFYNPKAAPPSEALPADVEGLATRINDDENTTGNPGAKNPNSTATGNGQFINSTWLQMVKQYRPDLARGKTDDQILAMRADPALSHEMTGHNAVVNAGALHVANLPVQGWTLAMAHKLGPGDAINVMNAQPDTPLTSILPTKVLVANPQLAKLTAGQYSHQLADKFGQNPINVGADANPNQLSGDALDYVAQQYVATGQLPPLGNGKVATLNRDAILNKAAAIERETGSTGYDAVTRHATIKAAAGSLASINKLKTMVTASEQTVVKNMDIVKGLAPKGAGPSGSPMLNTPIQYLRNKVWGSADVANFNTAIGSVADEYAKVLSTSTGVGGQTSDSMRQEAYHRLNGAQTLDQLYGVMGTMQKEMASRTSSLEEQEANLTATIRNKGVAPQEVASADNLPTLTPDQAAKVAKGTRFRTTDGRVLIRQ